MVTEDCVLRTWFLSVPEISSSILATAQQALMPPEDHLGDMDKWIILGIHQARHGRTLGNIIEDWKIAKVPWIH